MGVRGASCDASLVAARDAMDAMNFSRRVDGDARDEDARASTETRANDGEKTDRHSEAREASEEDATMDDAIGTCRVCLEDISRDDVECGLAVALGCACASSGHVHETFACRGAYAAMKRRAGETTCEICLHPLAAHIASLERSKRAFVIDIDVDDRRGGERERDEDGRAARDASLDAAESRVALRDASCAPCACVYACVRAILARRTGLFAFTFALLGALVFTGVVRPM